MRRSPFLALCGILATFGVALAHPDPVGDAAYEAMEAALAMREAPLSGEDRTRMVVITSLEGAELKAALLALEADSTVSAETRERLLYETIARLAEGGLSDRSELDILGHFKRYRSGVTYLEPACRSSVPKPLYPIAAEATAALSRVQMREGMELGTKLLIESHQTGDLRNFVENVEQADGAFADGAMFACMFDMPFRKLQEAIAEVGKDLGDESLATLTLVALRGYPMSPLHSRLVEEGNEGVVLEAMRNGELPLEALVVGATTPGRESASLLAIGHNVRAHRDAPPFLLSQLSTPNGGSAAQAIAEAHDPDLTAQVAAAILTETDPLTLARMALALRLEGSDAAKAALAEFAKRDDVSAELRREAVQ